MEETQDNEPGLKELVKKLIEQNEAVVPDKEKKKEKKFKLPGRGKVSNGKVKKGWATFQIIRNNGEVSFTRAPIDDEGTVMIEGFPRVSTIDYRMTYGNKPFYILPEWSMKPFSPADNYDDTEKQQMNMTGRRLVASRLQRELMKPKAGFGNIGWILLALVGGIVVFYLIKGGKVF